jgi:gas vesicle protein
MKYLIGFLAGTAFGAAIALLYAPMSGDELRGEIRREADTRYQQVQSQVQKGLTEMNSRLDKMTADVKAMIDDVRESLPEGAEEAAE